MVARDANPPTQAGVPSSVRAVAGALALGRVGLGVTLLLAPKLALERLGFRRVSPTTAAVARLAGARDLIIGAEGCAALLAREPRRLRRASLAAAAADAGDAAIFASLLAAGDETAAAGRIGTAAALPAALAGLWVSARARGGRGAGPDSSI
jgi:hypothetical protein